MDSMPDLNGNFCLLLASEEFEKETTVTEKLTTEEKR